MSGNVPCYGEGKQMMSVIHLSDCAAMIDTLSREGVSGQNLNIFSGNPVSQAEFSSLMAEILEAEVEYIPQSILKRRFGSTVTDALCSSSAMVTGFPEMHKITGAEFSNTRSMLSDVIRLLKNKQGILPDTP